MSAGAELLPTPLDGEGMMLPRNKRRSRPARVAYVTPSHQYPLGMTMTAARRMSLLNWARSTGSWIVEDDYDSEYRFDRRPIASVQGLDTHGRVIYIGTFSKVLFPSLRVGYVVVPKDLAPVFASVRDAGDIFSSTLYQAVLTDFIREGHFAGHVRRMRMLYMERRQILLNAVRTHMGEIAQVIGDNAGMHFVVLLPRWIDDGAVAKYAAEDGISAMPLSSCYMRSPDKSGLILGYGGVNTRQIHEGVQKLAIVVKRCLRSNQRRNAQCGVHP
jgi:GntR family transcriptional regulator/MocR family aminotransferase